MSRDRGRAPRLAPALVVTAVLAVAALVAGGAAIGGEGHRAPASATAAVRDDVTLARAALPAGARDVHGDPGGELLSVDPRGDGTDEVVLYDYSTNRTHDVLVRSGVVIADQAAAHVQPPASGRETTTAFAIALGASPALAFTKTFAEQQGVPLVSADQVHVQAETWTAPGAATPEAGAARAKGAAVCGLHRCVQLMVATAAGEYLDTRDFVVDLSARRVLRLKVSS